MAAKDADTLSIAPLRRLFLELDGELVERDVEQMKFLLRGEQLKERILPSLYSAKDIFIELEMQGHISESNLDLLLELFNSLKRRPLKKRVVNFLEMHDHRKRKTKAEVSINVDFGDDYVVNVTRTVSEWQALFHLNVITHSGINSWDDARTAKAYMEGIEGITCQRVHHSCLEFIVKCSSIEALDRLWEEYQSNSLYAVFKKAIITDEILKTIGAKDIPIFLHISEDEYTACRAAIRSKTGKMPKVIPLCYPDNYVWKMSKGVLEQNGKSRGKLVVCEDAIDLLRSIEGPICPVVVTGPHRCGKSYIASQLIEPRPFDCAFQTSSKMRPQTTGIWMSTDVFKRKTKNKAEMSVVIMDTEGLGAYNAYNQDDLQLFSLMTLLSSVLVYNSRGSLTSEDIKQLSWVSTLGDMIHGEKDGKTLKCREDDFIRLFPNFMWLLRDVTMSFTLERDGEEEDVEIKEYILEEVLRLEKETAMSGQTVKEYNGYRRAVLKSFPIFDAVKLPLPSIDPKVLAKMDKGANRNRLNPTFLSEVDDFVERCGKLIKPKKAWPYVGNITGRHYAELLKQYVTAFASPCGMLQINTVSHKVIETLLDEVRREALDDYKTNMAAFAESALPCDTHEIINAHNKYRLKAMGIFEQNSKCINDVDRLHSYRQSLKDLMATYNKDDCHKCIGGELYKILMSNERKSEAFCRELVENLGDKELRPLIDAKRSEGEINMKINKVAELYKAKARDIWDVDRTDLLRKTVTISGVASTFKDKGERKVFEEGEDSKEKEKAREEMRIIKIQEEETLRRNREKDIIKLEKQVEDDYNERSEALLTQVTQLLKTHAGLAKELQEVRSNFEEETKKMKEELNMKKKQIL